jgi:glutamate mutase epsilon subunit
MDQHFKLLRADEEIQRLNVEIRRFVTYIHDEDEFLGRESRRLQEEGELALAHQVILRRSERSRFTPLHMSRLTELSKLRGFTGNISPGVSLCREHHVPVTRDVVMRAVSPDARAPPPGGEEDRDEGNDDGDDDEDGNLAAAFTNIVHISSDENAAAGHV